jgi:poly(3-hydroxybutyrate) depolymerase
MPIDSLSDRKGKTMNARIIISVIGCMGCLSACAPMSTRQQQPQQATETEKLQQATSLAIGNLAWESVQITEVKKENNKVSWVGLTRSNKYVCTADLSGDNSACDRISLAPPPTLPRPAVAGQAGVRAPQAMALSTNTVNVAGADRSYFYYVSSHFRPDAYNYVVYALHDNGQTAEEFARKSGWIKLAEADGFVVVFPESNDKSWSAVSGAEDAYLKAVYDHASRRLMVRGGEGGGQRPGGAGGARQPRAGQEAAGAQEGARAQAGGGEGEGGPRAGAGGAGGAQRVSTWPTFHYLTGVGAGATVAQEFVLDYPGVFAAVATLNGGAYDAAYAHGTEEAQGLFKYFREGKVAKPVWKEAKQDVPVAAWLFTTGTPSGAISKLEKYWKHADAVAAAATHSSIGQFQTTIYRNSEHEARQIRTTTLADTAGYDEAMANVIWHDFFEHIGRWPSSPNGDLGTLLTEAEIAKSFDIHTVEIANRSYKYYVKTPSTYRKGQSLPVVLAAHGAFFPIIQYMNQIKMHEVGEKKGFITVYLNGYQNRWEFIDPDGPDAQFVLRAIDEVVSAYGADRSRVYMQGFSLGSGLTYMMGITHPRVFAAISPNNGIGPMSPQVEARIAEIAKAGDLRIPTMIVYGDVDSGASADAKIPAQGVLRGAIDEMKRVNKITTPDKVERFNSPNTAPYDVLLLGGKNVGAGVDKRYPKGRFQITTYTSAAPQPLDLFSFVWVTDLPHAADPRTAQLEWDYFKHWRRNADGSVAFGSAYPP